MEKEQKNQGKETLAKTFSTLAKQLLEHHDFSEEELHDLIGKEKEGIPATAFDNDLTPLETITRYYENQPEKLELLNRPASTLRNALENSYEKQDELVVESTDHRIPVETFGDKTLSPLETLCRHLKQKGLKNKEIADLIGKDPRTIWTVLDRAKEKVGGET